MLVNIAQLEGAAELLPPSRESSVVRSKLQEARLAEQERLRQGGEDAQTLNDAIEDGLARGRRGAIDAATG